MALGLQSRSFLGGSALLLAFFGLSLLSLPANLYLCAPSLFSHNFYKGSLAFALSLVAAKQVSFTRAFPLLLSFFLGLCPSLGAAPSPLMEGAPLHSLAFVCVYFSCVLRAIGNSPLLEKSPASFFIATTTAAGGVWVFWNGTGAFLWT